MYDKEDFLHVPVIVGLGQDRDRGITGGHGSASVKRKKAI